MKGGVSRTASRIVKTSEALPAAQALAALCPTPPRLTVVTRGAHGAVALDAQGERWQCRSGGGGPFSVGSGDAFLAGLVAGLRRGVPQPLALAVGAGAANAEQPGAGLLERTRAEHELREDHRTCIGARAPDVSAVSRA